MKKFLKVFIIVLLVIASVAGTCYFFFKNMKERDNTTASIAGVLYSEEKSEFNSNLQVISALMNSDSTDTRLNLIITTNAKMDQITKILASYHIANNTKINNERISKAFNQFNSSRNLLTAMINEYNIKKDSSYFNRHTGANDLYSQACNYLISYARFINYVNSDLNLNKSCDIKFSMFDVYTHVVMTSFNETKTENSMVIIKNAANINKINSILQIDNSIIKTEVNTFAKEINLFSDAYYNCNKTEFAANLATNITLVTSSNQDTNEKIATYYLKQIFKV